MPITIIGLKNLRVEISRINKLIEPAIKRLLSENRPVDYPLVVGSKETAAVRRASMDLTRVLSELRRP
jgi:hypothetical protein